MVYIKTEGNHAEVVNSWQKAENIFILKLSVAMGGHMQWHQQHTEKDIASTV